MIINSTIVYALAWEMNKILAASKILEIRANFDFREVLFLIRTESGRHGLLISIHAEDYRVEILDQKQYRKLENQFPNKSIFTELIGATIETVEQIDFDRIMKFSCVKSSEQILQYDLYLELTGRSSNLILVNRSNFKIVDVLKTFEQKEGLQRTLLPDYTYKLPPPPPQKNPFSVSESEFKEIIQSKPDLSFKEILSKTFLGVDKLLAEEIWFLAGLGENPVVALKDSELDNLARHFQNTFYKIREHTFHPIVILGSDEQAPAISVVDLKSVQALNKIKSESVADAVSDYFRIKFIQAEKENLKKQILQILNSQLKKLEGRTGNLRRN